MRAAGKARDRDVVLRYGNPRYTGPGSRRQREEGGLNIEFEDEDPAILEAFNAELAKRDMEPFVPTESAAR